MSGALRRARDAPFTVVTTPPPQSVPGASARLLRKERPVQSVVVPLSIYERDEDRLRAQLDALSPGHLVNIIAAYELSDEPAAALNRHSTAELIETIVQRVRVESEVPR